MYKDYYGLNADPFRLASNSANLFTHRSLKKARSYLKYGLHNDEGLVLVTGESGTGKSTLIQSLLSEDASSHIDPVVLECSTYTGTELLQLYAKNLPDSLSPANIVESMTEIENSLTNIKSEGKKALLVLDEAQRLTNDALSRLLHLSNLKANGEHLLVIYLVGSEALRHTILLPEHEQLHQRLVATCRIDRLSLSETTEYIVHNLSTSGWNGSPEICSKAYNLIHNCSMGIPRWINLIGSRILLHGMATEKQRLELSDVGGVLLELLSEDLLPVEIRQNFQKSRNEKAA